MLSAVKNFIGDGSSEASSHKELVVNFGKEMKDIKLIIFLLNLEIALTLLHFVFLGCSLKRNVLMYPSYYIDPNYDSNNASQGCGLSRNLEICQSEKT